MGEFLSVRCRFQRQKYRLYMVDRWFISGRYIAKPQNVLFNTTIMRVATALSDAIPLFFYHFTPIYLTPRI